MGWAAEHVSLVVSSSAATMNKMFIIFREIKKYHFVDLSRLVIMGAGVGGHIAARVLAEDSG